MCGHNLDAIQSSMHGFPRSKVNRVHTSSSRFTQILGFCVEAVEPNIKENVVDTNQVGNTGMSF